MYIMFRSVLFLALFETTLSISRNLPKICEQATTFTCKPKTRIPWTECGGEYLPACDATRCCTYKPISVRIWNDVMMEGIRNGTIHIDAIGDAYRASFLIKAARDPTEKNLELAIKLLGDGASVNLQDETGMTALMFAARLGNANLVKKLLDANASTAINDENALNAMMYATNRGHVQVLEHLLDHCAKVSIEAVNAASGDLKKTLTRAQKYPLIAAVLRESGSGLEHILQNQDSCLNGASIDSVDEEQWTALTHATNMNRPDMVEILLAQNAQIGTELVVAARKGSVQIGYKLVAKGADVTADNEKAIVTAVAHSRTAFVNFLIEKGASVDARNENDEPVLFVATAKDNTKIVSILAWNHASISATNCSNTAQTARCEDSKVCYTALTLAMKENYDYIAARILFEAKHTIRTEQVLCEDGQNYSPLTWASKYEQWGIVSRLLRMCADISFQTDGKTSLEIAQDTNNADIISQLEEARWPLITAITKSEFSSVSGALQEDECNNMDVNEKKDGKSLLMFAVDLKKKDIVEELILLKADVNLKNDDGQTALMLAAKKSNAIVESLLRSPEIEVSAQDKDGRSALMIAAESCFMENVKSFVADGRIDVDAADNEKQTALMHAVRCSSEVVRSLLGKGANVGARGDQRRTALMQAVDHCNAPVVSVLLEKGNANLSMRYEDNETVQMHAVKKCEVDVVNPLVYHSSKDQINAKKLAATALMIAVEYNRSFDIIESILRHPNVSVAPTKRKTDSALVRAVRKNRTDIVEPLLAKMANERYTETREVEYNETITVMGIAVQENVNVKIVELLLEYNATVDHRFMRGLSMTDRNSEIVKVIQDARWPLLKKIENRISGLSIKNEMTSMRHRKRKMELDECMSFSEPQTMFMAAATANNTDAMEQLLRLDEKHRYIDQTCDTGETPLCIAAKKNHVEIAKLLLNECPNVDLRCDKRNYEEGIAPEKMNTYGNSALEIANGKGHSDIAQEIRYKKWILLGKIARNGAKSVEELRKEHLEGGHKCDITIANRSYEIDPSAKCDRGETVREWASRYGQEDILAEIGASFSSFTAPTTTTVTPAPGNTTSTDPKDGDDDDFPWEYLGFVAIIPVCIGIAYAVWRYYPTPTVQASKMPSNMAVATEIPRNVANIKTP